MYKKKKAGRKSRAPSKAEFEFKYYELDIEAKELAKEYGVKVQTIYNWATMYREMDKV